MESNHCGRHRHDQQEDEMKGGGPHSPKRSGSRQASCHTIGTLWRARPGFRPGSPAVVPAKNTYALATHHINPSTSGVAVPHNLPVGYGCDHPIVPWASTESQVMPRNTHISERPGHG